MKKLTEIQKTISQLPPAQQQELQQWMVKEPAAAPYQNATMKELSRKQQLLDGAGYIFRFDHGVYVDRASKKVFSVEFIDDHNADELEARIQEMANGSEWHFYFNSPPPPSVVRQLKEALA